MKSVSNDWFKNDICPCGTHNGYVAIPPTNKYYNMPFKELEEKISVHGGVTWFKPASLSRFILKDAEFISDNTEIGDDWKIVGFDTFHFNDDEISCDKEYVIQETLDLQRQLEEE